MLGSVAPGKITCHQEALSPEEERVAQGRSRAGETGRRPTRVKTSLSARSTGFPKSHLCTPGALPCSHSPVLSTFSCAADVLAHCLAGRYTMCAADKALISLLECARAFSHGALWCLQCAGTCPSLSTTGDAFAVACGSHQNKMLMSAACLLSASWLRTARALSSSCKRDCVVAGVPLCSNL